MIPFNNNAKWKLALSNILYNNVHIHSKGGVSNIASNKYINVIPGISIIVIQCLYSLAGGK